MSLAELRQALRATIASAGADSSSAEALRLAIAEKRAAQLPDDRKQEAARA